MSSKSTIALTTIKQDINTGYGQLGYTYYDSTSVGSISLSTVYSEPGRRY